MGFEKLISNSHRPLTDEQAEATDSVFPKFAVAHDYRDQVVSEFLKLEPIQPQHQTRKQPLPPEIDRARRAIRRVAESSNRTESNVEQRVKQIYDDSGEKETVIARLAEELKQIEANIEDSR